MKNKNGFLLIAAGLLFGIGFWIIILVWIPTGSPQKSSPPGVGLPAADFTVDSLSGESIRLSKYRGMPVVLNFWATWCPPCKEEMPLFDEYAERLAGQAVFIAVDAGEEDEVVRAYIDESGIGLPIGLDRDGVVTDLYYVRSFPVTFFIDSEGITRAQHIGQLDEDLLMKYLVTIGINE